MDIQEIKDLWNYFSFIWQQKISEINWEKEKKKKGSTFCSFLAWLRADKLFKLGSFLCAFYFPLVFKIPLLAWQIMSLGNKSIRTGQVWDKRKLFCKQHVFLPACAYFWAMTTQTKPAWWFQRHYSDKPISSESRGLYPVEETDPSPVIRKCISVLCSHAHGGTLLSWAAVLRKWGRKEPGAGSWMEETKPVAWYSREGWFPVPVSKGLESVWWFPTPPGTVTH